MPRRCGNDDMRGQRAAERPRWCGNDLVDRVRDDEWTDGCGDPIGPFELFHVVTALTSVIDRSGRDLRLHTHRGSVLRDHFTVNISSSRPAHRLPLTAHRSVETEIRSKKLLHDCRIFLSLESAPRPRWSARLHQATFFVRGISGNTDRTRVQSQTRCAGRRGRGRIRLPLR